MPRCFQIENEIADFARAGGIDAGGRFVEHDQLRLLNERLGQPDALQHSLGITAEPPIARLVRPTSSSSSSIASSIARRASRTSFP